MTASLNHTLTASECRRSGARGREEGGEEEFWDGKTQAKFYINCQFCQNTKGPVYQIFGLYINFSSLYRVYYCKLLSLLKHFILFLIEAVLFNVGNSQMDVCILVIRNIHLNVRDQLRKTDVRISYKNYIQQTHMLYGNTPRIFLNKCSSSNCLGTCGKIKVVHTNAGGLVRSDSVAEDTGSPHTCN